MDYIRWLWPVAMLGLMMAGRTAGETRRDVFVDPHAALGGDGTREAPYSTIQEAVDKHESDWGQVFLQPGVYREEVDIGRGRYWFFPAQQYGVELEGSITVRRPGTKIRGLIIRSRTSGIVLADGGSRSEIQHCRITQVGEGCAGIEVAGEGVSGCLINGNVVELGEGQGRAGMRVAVRTGVTGNHLDHNQIAGCETGIALVDEGGTEDQVNTVTGNRLFGCGIEIEAQAARAKVAWNEVDGEVDADPFAAAASRTHEPRTVHVAPGAEAGGSGPADDPFTRMASALEGAGPGDVVVLAAGEYSGDLSISAVGAADAPITIRAAAPLGAVVRAASWRLEYAAHVRIEGIDFVAAEGSALVLGPYVQHCAFVGNRIVREPEGGGSAITVAGPAANHNLFEGNTIKLNHGGVGLQAHCQRHNWHLTIRGNDISGCYYGIQTGAGSYPTAPPGYHLIEGNELHHNWKDGFHSKTTDNIFRENHVHHNDSYGVTTRYGSRNVFVGNWVHDNGGGVRLHSKSHFLVNNVIYRNKGHGVYLGSWPGDQEGRFPYSFEPFYEPPHEVWIAHNTIAGNGGHPIFADNGSQLMVLRNILVGGDDSAPGIYFGPGGVARQVEQNLYWRARPPLLREYEGGQYERVGDPLFADPEAGDFRVAAGSPALSVPPLGDALSFVLSTQPCGLELGEQIGASLGPPPT